MVLLGRGREGRQWALCRFGGCGQECRRLGEAERGRSRPGVGTSKDGKVWVVFGNRQDDWFAEDERGELLPGLKSVYSPVLGSVQVSPHLTLG